MENSSNQCRYTFAFIPAGNLGVSGIIIRRFCGISAVSIRELLLLLGMGLAYQMLESAVCFAMIRRRLPTFSYRQAVEVTFLGVFGNVSTLSVGSVPMQSYYLHHCGMMTGCGIGTMMLEYIFHKSSVLIYTTVMLLFQGRWLSETGRGFSRYIPLGYGICALIIAALVLLCAWEKVPVVCILGD